MDSLEGIEQIDNDYNDNPYYMSDTVANPISHFDLAKASKAIPGAVGPCDSPQSYIPEKELAEWASTRATASALAQDLDDTLVKGPYRSFTGPGQIRVLEIKPGTGDETIRCALHHCSVEFEGAHDPPNEAGLRHHHPAQFATAQSAPTEPVWYTALSYRWGDPKLLGSPVEIGEHQIQITKSLEEILRYLRNPDRSIIMWIDQICVNQKDIEDKALQIPLMSEIYGRAMNTLIWLTPWPEFPLEVDPFRLFHDCAVKLQFLEGSIPSDDFGSLGLPQPDSKEWAEVWFVLSQPYFQRLWIIQEVALSIRPWLACGSHLISWRVFSDACHRLYGSGVSRWLMEKFESTSHEQAAQVPLVDVCHSVIRLDELAYLPIRKLRLWTLEETRGAISYDPRDKIYGILGLDSLNKMTIGPDPIGWALNVSYAENYTAARLYHDIAVQILTTQSDFLVSLLINVDHLESMSGLPSWVPDWSRPRQTTSIGAHLKHATVYKASDGKSNHSVGDDDDRELHVYGKAFDTISTLTAVITNPDITWRDPMTHNDTLLSCYNMARTLSKYPGDKETVFAAFWRTVVADKDAPLGLHRDQTSKEKAPAAFEEIISLLLDASTGLEPSLPGQTYSKRQRLPPGNRGRLEPASLATRKPGKTFEQVRVAMQAALANRCVGVTSKGYLGLFPGYVKSGDFVCVLRGCHVPFVLRQAEQDKFIVLGECYVHGIMQGEAMEDGDSEFVLI